MIPLGVFAPILIIIALLPYRLVEEVEGVEGVVVAEEGLEVEVEREHSFMMNPLIQHVVVGDAEEVVGQSQSIRDGE